MLLGVDKELRVGPVNNMTVTFVFPKSNISKMSNNTPIAGTGALGECGIHMFSEFLAVANGNNAMLI